MRPGAARDAGFSLFEALIALVIVSLGMSSFYAAIGGSYRAQSRIKAATATVEQARSQLDGLGADVALEAGSSSGRYPSGARWQMTVTPLSTKDARDPSPTPPAFWVVLQVRDGRGRPILLLETAKIGGAMP